MFDQLETNRLLLRRFLPSDARDCFAFLSDRETCRLDGGYSPFAAMDSAYQGLMNQWLSSGDTRRMIVYKLENRVIGTLHFMDDPRRCIKSLELGFVISPAFRRRGLMQEALEAVIRYLFDETDVRMVTASAVAENLPSLALLAKMGFCREGRLHNAFSMPGVGITDLECYYLDKP